ncbi:MAG: DUF58 domain-containing protein [Spirulina sp. SIO3F2]|nr:DUF58 domain-containing protein [Spirulina sp. SIO3F2]
MIPASRFYWGLLLGGGLATLMSCFAPVSSSAIALGIWDSLLLLAFLLDGFQGRDQHVTVSRLPINKLSVGRDNPIQLQVAAQTQPARVQIRDTYPPEFAVSTPQFQLQLAAQERQDLLYTINPDRRCQTQWQGIQVRQLGRWQLTWHNWRVPAAQNVLIYPDLVGLRSLSIRLALQNTGTMRKAQTLGQGTEFRELRDYRQGDDLRKINWNATARRSQPIVQVLEPEREQTLIVLLDQGRLMTAQVDGLQRFDWGVNATLSLAMAGIERGDRVGVGVFDKTLNTWLPPERHSTQFLQILERLAPLQPNFQEPDYFGVINQIVAQQTRRALVVILTDIVDHTASSELLTALARLVPRYLPLCVTLRDPQVDAIAHTSDTLDPQAAYHRAVALDLLAQRQGTFRLLQQQGVLVLDAPAHRISEDLVDHYLRLKARDRL